MVEGDGCSRPNGGSAGPPSLPPGRDDRDPRPLPPSRNLPGLLASLGRYLEDHAPEGLVVLLRAEIERRELDAYASGWRDAAAEYEPALRQAAQARRLSLVSRTPGQAAVIPFPPDRRAHDAEAADRLPEERADPAPAPGDASERPPGPPSATGGHGAGTPTEPERHTRATFVPKSRSSKVPTIPRLRRPRPFREGREEGEDA
ncbi:hypothetical protein [Streptomyces sp. Wb2n-11]|uniref:hypothetical protein n=1 Tax=Streptomyces sp. Wb2n-11 TaxID=1030533 RepID=UPI000B269BA5|nr:hypothetical protein [Streptomyces sp. Wb2n-11]